jgi:hypothetical protein
MQAAQGCLEIMDSRFLTSKMVGSLISAMMMAFYQMLSFSQTASFVKQDAKRSRRNGIITRGRALTELFRRIG